MTRLVIFDLDGVLIDSKEIHFNSLNLALAEIDSGYIISRNEQDDIFEGLTTNAKLNILTEMKGVPEDMHKIIWELKQQYSAKLFTSVSKDKDLVSLFKYIKSNGISIAVASNSIRATLDSCLKSLGVYGLVDYSLSNEDVAFPKPSPEIYLACIDYFKVLPENVVIFEDSEIGLRSAYAANVGLVVEVENRNTLTLELISKVVKHLNP